MTAAATQKKAPAGLSNKARERMEAINAEAGKHNIWVRTQANAPAQRPWFSETRGEGSGQLASGRVAANQMKTLPHMWQWKDFSPYLHRISEIARKADISPLRMPAAPSCPKKGATPSSRASAAMPRAATSS